MGGKNYETSGRSTNGKFNIIMRYLNTKDINDLGQDWPGLISVIEQAVIMIDKNDFSQPIKPYLRFREPRNRIIAMPAYIGGDIDVAGIKWIASFPDNINKGLSRAQSVTILNDTGTGAPFCIINTSLVSGIRTAAVSGLIVRKYIEAKQIKGKLKVGMTGFGPIGQLHLGMINGMLGSSLETVCLHDIRPLDLSQYPNPVGDKLRVCNSYEEAFEDADIFITATVSKEPYISIRPKPGSLHLNVSLRDYRSGFIAYVDRMIVDNWEEVCRENTDIERMFLNEGLKKEDTIDIATVVNRFVPQYLKQDEVVMFNPMGMAVFDMAIAKHYYDLAQAAGVGCELN